MLSPYGYRTYCSHGASTNKRRKLKYPGLEDHDYLRRRHEIAADLSDDCCDILYTEAENKTWEYIYRKLNDLYSSSACMPYRQCLESMSISPDLIPQFREINEILKSHDFQVLPVQGLIDTRVFLERLSRGSMLCTRYIRHHSHPEYTPEPDIVHEVMGHCVFFADEKYRELNKAFGNAAVSASDDLIEKIAQIYWYTVEFGVCSELGEPKAWGAGLLSSIKELENVKSIPTEDLDLEKLMMIDYDTMNPHEKLYRSKGDFYETADEIIDFLNRLTFK